MAQTNKVFEKGEFIRYINKPTSFGIFEGIDLDPTMKYAKKWSMVLFFDPSKYCQNEDGGGYSSKPVLEVAKGANPCPKTIDTDKEDYSWRICTPTEKKECIEKLAEFGLEWDEENMELVDIMTREILHKVFIPKIEYNGEIVKPVCHEFKKIMKKYVIAENKPTYTNYGGYTGCHSPYYNGRYSEYDEYGWD